MQLQPPFREPARVQMHLNGGYTRVSLVRTEGLGMADGGVLWDIPTEVIPLRLRCLGSLVLVVMPRFTVEDRDTPEDIRRMIDRVEAHEWSEPNEAPTSPQ